MNIDELWWTYCKEKTMPAPHDLDPPAMTEAERLAKKRQDALIGYEMFFNRLTREYHERRMTSTYVDALTIHHTMP